MLILVEVKDLYLQEIRDPNINTPPIKTSQRSASGSLCKNDQKGKVLNSEYAHMPQPFRIGK